MNLVRSCRSWALVTSIVVLGCGAPASSPPADGGLDAAPAPDAGLDAGLAPDAFAAPDTGALDTGALDTGALDAATLDAAIVDAAPAVDGGLAPTELAFVATYLGGISVLAIDETSGALDRVAGSPFDDHAHFYAVAVHPSAQFVYAADLDAGDVVAYRVDAHGALMHLSTSPLHVGGSPSTLAMDPSGEVLYVGIDSALLALAIAADGTLSMPAGSSTALSAVPGYLAVDVAGHHLYVSYSASGGVSGFTIGAGGALTPIAGSPFAASAVFGGGLAIDATGAALLDVRFALHALAIDGLGRLSPFAASPVTTDVSADPSSTSVAWDPAGHFAYAVNMGMGHIVGFAVDTSAGTFMPVPGSPIPMSMPYSLAIDPSGQFLYVATDTGAVQGFRRDTSSGELMPLPGPPTSVPGLQPEIVIAHL